MVNRLLKMSKESINKQVKIAGLDTLRLFRNLALIRVHLTSSYFEIFLLNIINIGSIMKANKSPVSPAKAKTSAKFLTPKR